jgi:hypothetical protein
MSETHSSQPSQKPPAKARNPIERIVVYGVIAALIVLVGIEANGKFQHKTAVDTITAKLQNVENDVKAPEVTEDDIKAVLGSKQPVRSENYGAVGSIGPSKKLEVYSWFSLNPSQKRELWVHYGQKGPKDKGPITVIGVSTDAEVAAPVKSLEGETPSAGGPGPGGMGPPPGMMRGGPGMGPPGAGGPGGRGRPGAGADGEKADEAKTEAATTDDKSADEKTADETPDNEKKGEPEADKSEAKPE